MDGIKKVNKGTTTVHSSNVDHRRIQKSATLNRKFVKRPTVRPRLAASAGAASKSLRQYGQQRRADIIQRQNTVKIQPTQQGAARQQQQVAKQATQQGAAQQQQQQQRATVKTAAVAQRAQQQQARQQQVAARKQIISETKDVYQKNQTLEAAKARMAARKAAAQPEHLSAQELKDRAIKQALRKVERLDDDGTMSAQFDGAATQQKQHFWKKRSFAISACMAVIAIALLGYLVALNLPDISVRVAAMQTGIEKLYPSYVPSNYRLDGLVKEEAGRVTMNFKNEEGKKFILMEEKSSWDSAAVLSNYVKKNWGSDYSIAKGQGLTIYISGSNAVWVNGGVFYMISNEDGSLTATDLHDIAVSL